MIIRVVPSILFLAALAFSRVFASAEEQASIREAALVRGLREAAPFSFLVSDRIRLSLQTHLVAATFPRRSPSDTYCGTGAVELLHARFKLTIGFDPENRFLSLNALWSGITAAKRDGKWRAVGTREETSMLPPCHDDA
jgi:hypothetical protein